MMKADSTIRRHSGFTLVEMIVAATVMAAVMLGLVQVFRMTTSAVSEANDALEAYQQARGVFSALSRDLAGLTKDGYLRIAVAQPAGQAEGEEGGTYFSDLLAFTTTGICVGVVPGVSNDWVAAAAEVVYTSNTRVSDSGEWLRFPWETDAHSVRKGVLSRQAYLIYPEAALGSADYSVSDVAGSPSLGQVGTLAEGTTRYNQNYGYMWPYSVEHGYTVNSALVGWVMATRVGEFKVEYLNDAGVWVREADTWGRGEDDSSTWPKALRVTVVIFGPADRAPLAESRNWDADTNKFQGYVFQQIFLLR